MEENEIPNIFQDKDINETQESDKKDSNILGNTISNIVILNKNSQNIQDNKNNYILAQKNQNIFKTFDKNPKTNNIIKTEYGNIISYNKTYSADINTNLLNNVQQDKKLGYRKIKTLDGKFKKIYNVDMNLNTQYDIIDERVIKSDNTINSNETNNKYKKIDKISEQNKNDKERIQNNSSKSIDSIKEYIPLYNNKMEEISVNSIQNINNI